jgi:UDP-N-acetylmuramoyl-tripeptide--D-alanyl-D-alanine ligase
MRPRPLSEVAQAVDGRLRGADTTVDAVVIDSREAGPGSLFFAMRGERGDGHDFVTDALSRGAVGAVVHRPVAAEPVVVVADSGRALLALAADERARMRDATVIGITGANGKTSTKDLAASILSTGFLTHASPGSFNNEIGLPLTLLGAPEGVEVVLAEMGARRRGDHAELCRVAQPDAVVVTNVGVAHMEVFGSWPAIVEASAEPVEALADVGTAILNIDDTVVRDLAAQTRARVVTFGLTTDADVRAEDVALDDEGRAGFDLVVGDERERAELVVPGEHMVSNALAAAACGIALGLSAAECAAGLKGVGVSRWRMESFTTEDGVRVVNDAYNANPESMAAGLRAARWMARGGRLVAVLGHMAELGPISNEEHERLGELVVRLGVDRLVTVGTVARAVAGAALREGAVPDSVVSVDTPAEATADVRGWARAGDVVLIKGSRVAGLERVAEALR